MTNSLPHQPLISFLTWSHIRQTVTLVDSQQQTVVYEFRIRTHHNGRELLNPEIALPEVINTHAVANRAHELSRGNRVERC